MCARLLFVAYLVSFLATTAQLNAKLRRCLCYSHSLQRYPLVKQAFWEQVLASDLMVGVSTTKRQQLQLRDERFPRLVLDFSRCKLTTELLESLRQFLADTGMPTTTLECPFSGVKVKRSAKRVVPVALKLVRCRLTADLINRLKTLLMTERRDFGEDSNDMPVRLCVTSLDLSENAMKTEELTVLAELLHEGGRRRQRRWELPLEELVLENALSRTLTTESWAAFRRLKTLLMTERRDFGEDSNDIPVRLCVTSLDLSENAMKTEELTALADYDLVLDRGICGVIFSYAANEKRRHILWNSAHT
ncbi:hypothetical protein PHPALM_32056 [Phytophthora palmivora]|uniref:RxLR effector candidate protein n=1 Tax=Phytophthora palmivora TaxID=4796 RepID=A0A2P4X124_9STRA|nr:hypothetical protein PHPALM_32056 [Phytophthora palmivora]